MHILGKKKSLSSHGWKNTNVFMAEKIHMFSLVKKYICSHGRKNISVLMAEKYLTADGHFSPRVSAIPYIYIYRPIEHW